MNGMSIVCANYWRNYKLKVFYSGVVDKLIEMEKHFILIPDLVLIKEGIACGDRLIIKGQVDKERLKFDIISSEACMLCKAASIDLMNEYNNLRVDVVYAEVKKQVDEFDRDKKLLFNKYGLSVLDYSSREECLVAPYKLLLNLIEKMQEKKLEYSTVPNTFESMECDACVSSCEINWTNKERKRMDHRGDRKYGSDYLSKWLPLGKIELLDDDLVMLRKMCASATESDLQFLSDYTMNSFVLKHLLDYAPDLIDKKWKKSAYLVQKNEINKHYVEEIRKYIEREQLNIYFVKGYISQKFYTNPALRIHSDYDVIATNSIDAFKLASYLMNNGFSIRPNLFSYKPISHNEEEKISGHFHLQRIIDDTYLLEFDISFPGFPLNRVQLYYPRYFGGDISVEDQMIITLLHLFKHSNVYMKDINDLFYMMQSDMDYDYLYKKIAEYDLEMYFQIVLDFILKNYPRAFERIKTPFIEHKKEVSEEYTNWPYDENIHKELKLNDYQNRIASSVEHERVYLYPVIIFKELYNVNAVKELSQYGFFLSWIDEGIVRCTYEKCEFYLTSIGVLIDSFIETSDVTRDDYIESIERAIQIFRLNAGMFQDVPFATEHFYVRDI